MQVLGVLESVIQKDGLVLECAAKEYLRLMSLIRRSPLSDLILCDCVKSVC